MMHRKGLGRAGLVALMVLVGLSAPETRQEQARVSGSVQDRSGERLAGVTVTATNVSTNETRTTTSSQDGRFVLTNLEPGRYSFTAVVPGFAAARVDDVAIGVGQSVTVDIVIPIGDSALGVIQGVVMGDGVPLRGASVEARQGGQTIKRTNTNASGRYDLEGLVPGNYQVEVAAEGFDSATQNVRLKEREVATRNFTLKRSRR